MAPEPLKVGITVTTPDGTEVSRDDGPVNSIERCTVTRPTDAGSITWRPVLVVPMNRR